MNAFSTRLIHNRPTRVYDLIILKPVSTFSHLRAPRYFLKMSEEREQKTLAPADLTSVVDSHTPVEVLRLAETTGIAKARLSWIDLMISKHWRTKHM